MGALRGSLTFTRFFVLGDTPDDAAAAFMKPIRANAFEPLTPDEDALEHHGWASVEDPFDLELDHEKVFFNEYLTLSVRIDRWVVPGPLLKAHLREAEEKLLERKSLERLGRKAKADLKDAVIKKLRKQLVPATKSVDLVWNLRTNVALLFSHSKKVHELASELFEKTFKRRLWVESPGTAAERFFPADARFADLIPTTLASSGESGRLSSDVEPKAVAS
ncbi:MAG: recombination-associated protein RdgC [Polyangiaceae bacterium]